MRSSIPGDTPEEMNKNLQRYFREVFSSPKGKVVLNVILTDLNYFDTCKDTEDMALNNYAKVLLSERLGLKDTVKITDLLLEGDPENREE